MNKELLTKMEELETRIKTLEQLLEPKVEDVMIDDPLEEDLPEMEESEDLPEDYCPGDIEIDPGDCDPEDPEEPTDEDIKILSLNMLTKIYNIILC